MILVIDISLEKLSYYEFVRPIEDILKRSGIRYITKHYKDLEQENIKKAKKIIICGTSLKDNEFLRDIDSFLWIKEFSNPILGICGGMQIIGLVFGGQLKKESEIGFYNENFIKEFLGLKGKQEVYHLHNNYVTFGEEFEKFTKSKIEQAVKHKNKEIYGTLFHPEVRQKALITLFCKLI